VRWRGIDLSRPPKVYRPPVQSKPKREDRVIAKRLRDQAAEIIHLKRQVARLEKKLLVVYTGPIEDVVLVEDVPAVKDTPMRCPKCNGKTKIFEAFKGTLYFCQECDARGIVPSPSTRAP
jgi:uncharacterized protein with PIN domain